MQTDTLKPERPAGVAPLGGSVRWVDTGDQCVKCLHDEGDFDGAVVTEASVVQGGNGLWTPSVYQTAKGRKKKLGQGRITGKLVMHYWPGQQKTREQAIALCERKWLELSLKAREASGYGDVVMLNDLL